MTTTETSFQLHRWRTPNPAFTQLELNTNKENLGTEKDEKRTQKRRPY